jgi:oleate hydratase
MIARVLKHWGNAVVLIVTAFMIFSGSSSGYAYSSTHPPLTADSQIYIVGSGLAGLCAAATAIQDAHVPGKNIHIFEQRKTLGGACEAQGGTGGQTYSSNGARLYDPSVYKAYRKFLARIPSYDDQKEMVKLGNNNDYKVKKTLDNEFEEFSLSHPYDSKTRLVGKNQERINHFDFGLSWRDRYDLIHLVLMDEEKTYNKRMDEYFSPHFFTTNLWYQWSSIFGFQQWHGLTEMRRYARKFYHVLPNIASLHDTAWSTQYTTYDSVIMPTVMWLQTQGVTFHSGCKVTDVDFKPTIDEKTVTGIHYLDNGAAKEIKVRDNDFVLISNGSKVADQTPGDTHNAPKIERGKVGGDWTLWESMARKQPGLGNPNAFTSSIEHSRFQVVSITSRGPLADLVNKFSKNKLMGEQHDIIFKDSPWQLWLYTHFQPYVRNQDKDVTILSAVGLKWDKGDYVKKNMEDCTGEEILQEICYQFGFMKEMPEILKTCDVTITQMPYVSSQFLPRTNYDRPPVVPDRSTNLAFIGEFTEIPEECVFLTTYSCKSAEIAIYTLLGVDKEVTPAYIPTHNLWYWIRNLYAIL